MRQLIISNSFSYEKAALLIDGSLEEFFYENNSEHSCLNNIYKGKIVDILPGMQSSFVDIGLQKNAYLYIDELLSDKTISEKNLNKKQAYNIDDIVKKGEELMVQVIREPIGEKYVSVSTDIAIVGKHIILVPKNKKVRISKKVKNSLAKSQLFEIGSNIMQDDYGIVMRTSAVGVAEKILDDEYKILLDKYKKIELEFGYSYAPKLLKKNDSLIEKLFIEYMNESVDEIYVENKETKDTVNKLLLKYNGNTNVKIIDSYTNLFEIFNIEKQIDELNNRKIELDNGGSIIIDSTEALTVIDVNSGKFVGTGTQQDETSLAMNLVALNEISRQIRLRNISGIIIVDFINSRKNDFSDILISKARELLKKDKAKTKILGMTKLNLMEITRKRKKENFYDSMNESCMTCNGSGKVASSLQIMFKIENILKKVHSNTSCNFVTLRCNEYICDKVNTELKKDIFAIEEKSKISISFIKDNSILSNKIEIEKMGKKV
jgi:ribonuclease G